VCAILWELIILVINIQITFYTINIMGLNISEIVQGERWKKNMAKLYGWGASLVIIGALFKLQHWQGASYMLTIGMGVEAVIFFFSAFEPIHEEVDWTLVYPELAATEFSDEEQRLTGSHSSNIVSGDSIKDIITGVLQELGHSGGQGVGIGNANIPAIDGDMAKKLKDGITNLAKTADSLGDISRATIATDSYIKNLNNASDNLAGFAESHKNTSEVLNISFGNLAESYENASAKVNGASDLFLQNIEKSGQSFNAMILNAGNQVSKDLISASEGVTVTMSELGKEFSLNKDVILKSSQDYQNGIAELNKNLSALNAVHQLQMQEFNAGLEESKQVKENSKFLSDELKQAASKTSEFGNNIGQLNQSLSSLNEVYGNMLSAVNYSK